MANYCIKCGAPLEGARFCTKCGEPAEGVAEQADLSGLDRSNGEPLASAYPADPAAGASPVQAAPGTQPTALMPQVQTQAGYQSQGASQQPTAQYAPANYRNAAQPAPKRGLGSGAKLGIVAAACVLGVGAGVVLALLHPWAPERPSSSTEGQAASSQVAQMPQGSSQALGKAAPQEGPATVAGPSAGSSQVPATTSSPSSGTAPEGSATMPLTPQAEAVSSAPTEQAKPESTASQPSASSSQQTTTTVRPAEGSSQGGAAASSRQAASSDYILPDSATRLYTRSELDSMSSDDLSRAQNEIWARHGRKFKNQWLQSYFDSKSWYTGTIEADAFNSVYKSTSIEDSNASLISSILSDRNWAVNTAHPN